MVINYKFTVHNPSSWLILSSYVQFHAVSNVNHIQKALNIKNIFHKELKNPLLVINFYD